MREDLENVECSVIKETEKAYHLREDGEQREAWFPKSQVSFARRNIKTGVAVAEIPLWLLREKGWAE